MKAKKLKSEQLPTSTEIKTHFGSYLMRSQKEPVVFQKNNQKAGVLISYEQFERFQALEDEYWKNRADTEGKEMLGARKSKEILDGI